MSALSHDFLGTGFGFPLRVTPQGRLAMVRSGERVEESIYLILSTKVGERVMMPTFGCTIHDLVFAPNNAATRTRAVDGVRRALVNFEPRIDVLEVAAETAAGEPSLLLIRVNYRLRATNALGNLVYPFYLLEAA
jgi:phage baseplate assembly protein W